MQERLLRISVCVLLTISMGFASRVAQAGNTDEVLVGNQAAITGGAITATVSDGTALWFNPAGLSQANRSKVDVSANAFVLRLYNLPNFIQANDGTRGSDANTMELVPIPSAVTVARALSDRWYWGAGIFVSQGSDRLLLTTLRVPASDGTITQWLANDTVTLSDSYFSLGIGHRATPAFSWGVGVFGLYQSVFTSTEFTGGTLDATRKYFVTQSVTNSEKSLGLEVGAGIQWQIDPRWRLGLSVRTPAAQLAHSIKKTDVSSGALPDGAGGINTTYDPVVRDELGINTKWLTPARIRLGLAHTFSKGFIALDGDIQPGITLSTDDTFARSTVFTWNLRVGGRYQLNRNFSVGGGLFTDRDPLKMTPPAGPENFYGFATGIEWNTAHPLAPGARSDEIIFSTTLGIRYAYGHGNTAALSLPANLADVNSYQAVATTLSINEFTINLGTGFYF